MTGHSHTTNEFLLFDFYRYELRGVGLLGGKTRLGTGPRVGCSVGSLCLSFYAIQNGDSGWRELVAGVYEPVVSARSLVFCARDRAVWPRQPCRRRARPIDRRYDRFAFVCQRSEQVWTGSDRAERTRMG